MYAQRESSMSRSSVKIVLAFTVVLVPMFSANAHGLYPAECCNGDGINGDCRPVSCSEIESIHDGWLWHGFIYCRRETAHARPVDLSSSRSHQSSRPERSVRDARHLDLKTLIRNALVRRCGSPQPAVMRIRLAAPTLWSRRGRGAVWPHDVRRVATHDATGSSAQWQLPHQ